MEKEVLTAMKKAGKPLRTGDIAKLIGKENKEVSKAMDALKKNGEISSPRGVIGSRPKGIVRVFKQGHNQDISQ